jgi:hypothetical protein
MATIDKLDIGIHNLYARRTELLEEIERFRLPETSAIPAQLTLVDFYARPSELELLLGNAVPHIQWAEFQEPKKFRTRRRSSFAFYQVAPTLGSREKQDEDERHADETECETAEEEREKTSILACFRQIKQINDWLSHVVGRIGQFLKA